jgi:hypothetical protein
MKKTKSSKKMLTAAVALAAVLTGGVMLGSSGAITIDLGAIRVE